MTLAVIVIVIVIVSFGRVKVIAYNAGIVVGVVVRRLERRLRLTLWAVFIDDEPPVGFDYSVVVVMDLTLRAYEGHCNLSFRPLTAPYRLTYPTL